MDLITDFPMVLDKNGLFVCIDKFTKFCWLIPILVGEGELSSKKVSYIFFDYIVQLFGVPSSVLHDKNVCFTA